MVDKGYDSVEYYTQTFKEHLIKFLSGFGGVYPVKHSSNQVSFIIKGIESRIYFEKDKEVFYIRHEIRFMNGQGDERKSDITKKLTPKKSKQGRISGYPEDLGKGKFILNNIRTFNEEYQGSKQ